MVALDHVSTIPTSQTSAQPLTVAADVSQREWDSYVSSHDLGTFDHLWKWQDIFADVFGHRSRYLAVRRGDQLAGVLPLVLFQSRLFGRFVASVPFLNYGGILATDTEAASALLGHARTVAAGFGASHVELRHVARQSPDLPFRQHKLQLTRELPSSADELWQRIDKKVRNLVRKAQKSELIVEHGGLELADAFYQVFAQNMRDLGTPVYSRRLFTETLRTFGNAARAHVVRHGQLPVAASITLHHGSTVLVPWASSLREYRHLSPNMLLYWGMMEHAVASGASRFDFGRSSPGSGTHQFKLQWGANERPLHWEYMLLTRSAAPDQGPQNPKFSLLIEAWKRLPVSLTTLIGPRIVRNIP